jgi:two-component system response regulator HydG
VTGARILLAEDHAPTRARLGGELRARGFSVRDAADGAEALSCFERESVDLVLSDHGMPRLDGLGLLRAVRRIRAVPFILYSAGAEPEVPFRAGRSGALRFLAYPFRVEEQLLPAIAVALEECARDPAPAVGGAARFLGSSPAARRVRAWIRRLAPTPASVVVLGETGTGKDVVARALHEESGRGPLVSFAVTELAESLLEAELFGAERGAFTGAVSARAGLLEQADGGTLFLDEIGDAPPALQAKLLRVLETGELRRVGGGARRRVALRVLAATHRDLAALVREGRFREDLFYRLAQATIRIPPLRERRADVEVLAAAFLREIAARTGAPAPVATRGFLAALRAHAWPGNARELRAVLQSALLWREGDEPLEAAHLLDALAALRPALAAEEQVLAQRMAEAFRRSRGNQEAARRDLGMTRAAWRHRWRRFGVASLAGDEE